MSICRQLLCLYLTLTVLSGCGRTKPSSGLIVSTGQFASPDASQTLTVRLTTNNTIDYSVTDPSGKQVFSSNSGSTYQRWFFFWDKAGNLWVHNSDLGSSVWSKDTGTWTQQTLQRGSPMVAKMPQEIRENLPQSLKAALGV